MLLKGGSIRITTDQILFPPGLDYAMNNDLIKVFILAYVKFLCDSPLNTPDHDKPLKVYIGFFKKLVDTNVIDLVRNYSQLSHRILSNEYVTDSFSTTGEFIPEMKETPIFREYHQWYKTGRPDLLKYITSFLLFGKKLEYEDEALNATSLRGWQEVEDKLHMLTFAERDLANIRHIISALLAPLNDEILLPKHGSGKVAERGVLDIVDKVSTLRIGQRLAYAFYRETFGLIDRRTGVHRARRSRGGKQEIWARAKFVRKDMFKSRSICMEITPIMYFQQEVHRWMRDSMDRGLMSLFCDLEDQTKSQAAAVHGSKYLSTDTIDLSSASDSVHVDLVRGVFPTKFRFYLMATRSSVVDVPGIGKIAVEKFAPMGSACCFPVQCIIFTAICILSYMAVRLGVATSDIDVSDINVADFIASNMHKTRTDNTPFTWRFEPPVVYGDDIAVDSRSTDEVISTLQRLGFTVNVNKSFMGSQSVRESCGVFAFGGHDITPVLYRLPFFKSGGVDASIVASFIGNINYVRDNGYHSLSSFMLSVLKGFRLKYRLPFQNDGLAFGIFTKNKHLVRGTTFIKGVQVPNLRWNADWQTFEELVLGIGPRSTKIVEVRKRLSNCSYSIDVNTYIDDDLGFAMYSYLYDQWWRSRIRGYTSPDFSRGLRVRAQETRIVPHWARYEQEN